MFVAALVILVIALVLMAVALFTGSDTVTLGSGLIEFKTTGAGAFLLGMFTLLLIVVALGFFRAGTRRAAKRRADRRKVSELSDQLDAYKREERESTPDHDDR
jgi:hypothetical protein